MQADLNEGLKISFRSESTGPYGDLEVLHIKVIAESSQKTFLDVTISDATDLSVDYGPHPGARAVAIANSGMRVAIIHGEKENAPEEAEIRGPITPVE